MLSVELNSSAGPHIKLRESKINYFNTFRLNNCVRTNVLYSSILPTDYTYTDLCRRNSGKKLPDHISRKLHIKSFYNKSVRLFFKYREECLMKDSDERIFTCKQTNYYLKMFTNRTFSNDPVDIGCTNYSSYLRSPHLLYLDLNNKRTEVLTNNQEFIEKIKYIPTPGIIRIASRSRKLDPELPKSAIIGLGYCTGDIKVSRFANVTNLDKEDLYDYLSSDKANIFKLKKLLQKERNLKFDLRSTKGITTLLTYVESKHLR